MTYRDLYLSARSALSQMDNPQDAGLIARDLGTNQSLENAGILHVFQIFQTTELGQKIRKQPQTIYAAVTY